MARKLSAVLLALIAFSTEARADLIRADVRVTDLEGVFAGRAVMPIEIAPFDRSLGILTAVYMTVSWNGGAASTFPGEISDFGGALTLGRLEINAANRKQLFVDETIFGPGAVFDAGGGLITVSDGNSRLLPVVITSRLNRFYHPTRIDAVFTGLFATDQIPGTHVPCASLPGTCTVAQRVTVNAGLSPIANTPEGAIFGPVVYQYAPHRRNVSGAVPEPAPVLLLAVAGFAALSGSSVPWRRSRARRTSR